jgi:hypothetical protein
VSGNKRNISERVSNRLSQIQSQERGRMMETDLVGFKEVFLCMIKKGKDLNQKRGDYKAPLLFYYVILF